MSNGFLSKRVKKRAQSGITSDRYEFLGLDQAEPDLGDPLVGPSSIAANPFTGDVTNLYFVASDGNGKRYWTKQTDVVAGGVVTPGSITVRDEGVIVGSVNQVTDINFVGSGVTITSPASWVGAGSSSVDIQIAVTDVTAAGSPGNIQYKGTSGFIQGSNDLHYDISNQRVGLGTNLPTQKLEVIGNTIISGVVTANSIVANNFTVNNFKINDEVLQFVVTSSAVGIGTTIPTATLDVRGDAYITGVATITAVSTPQLNATNANITGVTTSNSYYVGANEVISSARQLKNIASLDAVTTATIESAIAAAPNTFNDLNVTGISTLQILNAPGQSTLANLNVTGVTTSARIVTPDLNVTGVGTVATLNSSTIRAGIVTALTGNTVSFASSVGIGTTVARSTLDVNGDIRLSGTVYDFTGSPGTSGQVLLSNGSNPISWGSPSSIVAGSATSVTTIDKNSINTDYYVTFVQNTSGNQSIFLDSDSLRYNPSTNTLDVGTISARNLVVDGLNRYTTGVVTTTTTNEVVIDSLDINSFRSARYNIQVSVTGQLGLSTTTSVGTISSGTNYFPGTYENVTLLASTGVGTGAKATITIIPEATLPITASLNGLFTTSGSLTGIGTSQALAFNTTLTPSALEQSKVFNVTLTNAGSGYTAIPTFTFSSPIISGNPVTGVGVGSTAVGTVTAMKVSNIVLNSVGFVTNTVPTVTISSAGSGTTATANVGYGISTITVTQNGSGYSSIPSVSVGGNASVQVGNILITNIFVGDPGYGYTSGDRGRTIVFSSGDAVAVQTSFSLANSHLGYTITNPGLGYTAPPLLTVGSPQIGVNTGIASCTLGISTFIVTSPGSGYVASPTISNSPTVTGLAATVGLGVSTLGIQVSGGSNYTGAPTVTFNGVGGIGTGAQGSFTSINPDAPFNLQNFVITNPGFGYTVPPLVVISGGGGTGAAVTIRSMVVTDITISNTGYGVSQVVTSTLSTNPTELLDLSTSKTGTVGVATTSSVSPVVYSATGTIGIGTTVITGISTFSVLIRQKTGDLDSINDSSISGIDTSNLRVGYAVTGTDVQINTTIASLGNSVVGLSTNLTNSSIGFGRTFFFSDTDTQSVIVGQGVSGSGIDSRINGTTVVSIGASTVTISTPTINTGIQTNTISFGTLVTTPAVFQTTLISGINTSGISVGQRVVSTATTTNTNVASIGVGSVFLSQNSINVGIATTTFSFFDVTSLPGAGASITPSMGIGRVTTAGFGTGYLNLPGIAVTAVDGVTGGAGIVTTASLGIDDGCIFISNAGTGYTSIPNVLIGAPNGSGSGATGTVGIGISNITVLSTGSNYTGTKPTVTFSGSPSVSAAATVTNIVLTGVNVVSAGAGYTASNLPVTATFSNVAIGASVGLAVDTFTFTSGLGYTTTPTITFNQDPFLSGSKPTATALISGYDSSYNLLPGPGYGGTTVYYIRPVTSNTFRISRDIAGSNIVTLGYSTATSSTAFVGGKISTVSVSIPGSGYSTGNVLTAEGSQFQNIYSANVGTGFSFTVSNTVHNFQVSDLLLLQSAGAATTEAYIIEYAGIANRENLGEYSADISGSNARLKFKPVDKDNVIKVVRTSITN